MRGGGKKPFQQKGTGNARQGSRRTPLRPGGGVIFGPKVILWISIKSRQISPQASQLCLSLQRRRDTLGALMNAAQSRTPISQVLSPLRQGDSGLTEDPCTCPLNHMHLQPVDWTIKMNKKERRLAIATALQSAAESMVVIDNMKVNS